MQAAMTQQTLTNPAPAEARAAFHDEAPFTLDAQGQQLTFVPGGPDRLTALLNLIGQAQSSLKLCFYIFDDDGAGRQVRDALVDAAQRGVDVRLIVDGFGASVDQNFFAEFTAAGGTFLVFSANWGRRYLIRNHQKMAVADDQAAMFGGFNVADDYFAPPEANGWHDLGIVIRGSVVCDLALWFARLESWVSSRREQLRAIRRQVRGWDRPSGPVALLIGGPTARPSSWTRAIGHDLRKARSLDMVMAYFSPSYTLMRRIARIARTGEARLIMAGKSDNGATIGATRSLYTYLLKRGAKVWEFEATKLHMKLIVVDDAVYMGSANFDMRSLFVNLELMVRIEDHTLAQRMRAFIASHVPGSHEITLAEHRRKATVFNRMRWGLSWFLVTVVDYTVSRKLNLGL